MHVLLYLHAPGMLAPRCTPPLTPACDPDKDKIYLTALTSLRLSEQELGVELLFATEMNEHEHNNTSYINTDICVHS